MTAPSGYQTFDQLTPEQMRIHQQRIGGLGGLEQGLDYTSRLAAGDESLFKEIEAPAYAGLEKGLAQTATRFSDFGGQDSSGFQQALAGQSSQLGMDLASQRTNLRQDAIKQLLGLSKDVLGDQPVGFVKEEQPWMNELLSNPDIWRQLISLIGPMIGGPGGAAASAATAAGSAAFPARSG